MSVSVRGGKSVPVAVLAISLVAVALLFAWQGHVGLSLWDEGFLWYGTQRVMLGEVPMRDFMAYDPGRYYWTAALLTVTGNSGIIGLRAALAVFQVLGLFVGLLLVARSSKARGPATFLFWIVCGAILASWMLPRHKLFDVSLSIFLVGILTYLASRPTSTRYFFCGIGLGLVAVFGRNHGLYGAVASVGMLAWLGLGNNDGPPISKAIALWLLGVALGYLPIILMAVFIPGFAQAFWEGLRLLYEQNSTNLPIPVPWPWAVQFSDAGWRDVLQQVLLGFSFIGILAFGIGAILWMGLQRLRGQCVPPALVAAALLTLPYAHFAFSRADLAHLAQGIFPSLVGCLVVAATARAKIKWAIALTLLTASLVIVRGAYPGWQCWSTGTCVSIELSGDKLLVDRGTASDISLLRSLLNQYAPHGGTFLATPFWPGAYAVFGRPSPMWDVYALFRRSEAFERGELERIKAARPRFVVILDYALDGREALRFKNTHPLIYQYIRDNFDPVEYRANPSYEIYRSR